MNTVNIYVRFSPRPNARKCDSCEKQLERCEAYCNRMGYGPCLGVYEEENVSGGRLDRPKLQMAIEDLNRGDILLVDRSDRLARDMLVFLTICHEVEKKGARIEYADGTPPDMTPVGKLLRGVLALIAAFERDVIIERTKAGLARKKANGERSAGSIPIGKMLDPENPKRLVDCCKEQEAIELIYELDNQGWKSEYIAKMATKQCGFCRGKPWSARTIRRLLKRAREDNAHSK